LPRCRSDNSVTLQTPIRGSSRGVQGERLIGSTGALVDVEIGRGAVWVGEGDFT